MKWREDEDRTLTILKQRGDMTVEQIARYFPNRTLIAVDHRISHLKLTTRKTKKPTAPVGRSIDHIRYAAVDRAFRKHFEAVSTRRYDGAPL